ncbi:hypothetical protein D3C84_906240 [compost metagenome]
MIKVGLGSSRKGHLRQLWNAISYPPLHAQRDPRGVDIHLDLHDRDSGFPAADRVDRFAHQVWSHSVLWPVDIEVEIATELGPVRVAAFRRGQHDVDSLVDITQALDNLARSTKGRLPVRGGDAGIGSGRRHAPIMQNPRAGGF